MVFKWLVILIAGFNLVCCQVRDDDSIDVVDDVAEETQHAICQITSNDIETSANASITRQIKNGCTKSQLDENFKRLQLYLASELELIKQHLGIQSIKRQKSLSHEEIQIVTTTSDDYPVYEDFSAAQPLRKQANIPNIPRGIEIFQKNDTIHYLNKEKIYAYYWRLDSIASIMTKRSVHFRSGYFQVLGHEVCLQLFPFYELDEYLGLEMKTSTNFVKKHRFSILDQFDSSKDLVSQIYRFGVYKVPYLKLQERNYVYNDSVFVKIIIYLDS